ncbi:MAG: hypothetical protein DAHOPDDO_02647 [Ignavibacteriaceae bacterium]|nr:hypothetical protein [Ignavibacteriaceae bacterium]
MAEKKKFLLRIDENIHAALEKWAADDLRSINAQIEYLLTQALKNSNRLKNSNEGGLTNPPQNEPGEN